MQSNRINFVNTLLESFHYFSFCCCCVVVNNDVQLQFTGHQAHFYDKGRLVSAYQDSAIFGTFFTFYLYSTIWCKWFGPWFCHCMLRININWIPNGHKYTNRCPAFAAFWARSVLTRAFWDARGYPGLMYLDHLPFTPSNSGWHLLSLQSFWAEKAPSYNASFYV